MRKPALRQPSAELADGTGAPDLNGVLQAALHGRHFLSAWIRDPLRTGALWPSGPWLARAMAAQVDPTRAGAVIELGAGTGAITRALLARGVAQEQLWLVEKSPELVQILRQQFPRARVLHGDAAYLRTLMAAAGSNGAGTVVSSLPLLSMGRITQIRVLSQAFDLLQNGGSLVQFTYFPRPPISGRLEASLAVRGTRVAAIARNLPPAAVWVYARRSEQTGNAVVRMTDRGPESATHHSAMGSG